MAALIAIALLVGLGLFIRSRIRNHIPGNGSGSRPNGDHPEAQ